MGGLIDRKVGAALLRADWVDWNLLQMLGVDDPITFLVKADS
jgi:hypothetical protein